MTLKLLYPKKNDARIARADEPLSRGVTLFEVLIVVAILAMVAGGVAVFALPQFQEVTEDRARRPARA